MTTIYVQPAADRRRQFATWAVAQDPKIRTSSPVEFAVPAHLFTHVPESALIGALVDGHRYVSPDEDAAQGRPGPGAPELLGVATEQGFTPPAAGSPEADAAAMVAATSPEAIEAAMSAVLLAGDLAASNAAATPGGALLPGRGATAGDALPEVPASAYGPDPVALDASSADINEPAGSQLPAPGDSDADTPGDPAPEGVFPCPGCDREFTTARGLRMHSRQAHAESDEVT